MLQGAQSSAASAAPEVGVFVGIQQMEYGGLAAPFLTAIGPYSATGSPFSVAAGRLSFTFGFRGPAVRLPSLTGRKRRLQAAQILAPCFHPVSSQLQNSSCFFQAVRFT